MKRVKKSTWVCLGNGIFWGIVATTCNLSLMVWLIFIIVNSIILTMYGEYRVEEAMEKVFDGLDEIKVECIQKLKEKEQK